MPGILQSDWERGSVVRTAEENVDNFRHVAPRFISSSGHNVCFRVPIKPHAGQIDSRHLPPSLGTWCLDVELCNGSTVIPIPFSEQIASSETIVFT